MGHIELVYKHYPLRTSLRYTTIEIQTAVAQPHFALLSNAAQKQERAVCCSFHSSSSRPCMKTSFRAGVPLRTHTSRQPAASPALYFRTVNSTGIAQLKRSDLLFSAPCLVSTFSCLLLERQSVGVFVPNMSRASLPSFTCTWLDLGLSNGSLPQSNRRQLRFGASRHACRGLDCSSRPRHSVHNFDVVGRTLVIT